MTRVIQRGWQESQRWVEQLRTREGKSGRHHQHRGCEHVVGVRLGLVAGLALEVGQELKLDLGLGMGVELGLVVGLALEV